MSGKTNIEITTIDTGPMCPYCGREHVDYDGVWARESFEQAVVCVECEGEFMLEVKHTVSYCTWPIKKGPSE